MVYLLKMVIFHGCVSHNQMVYWYIISQNNAYVKINILSIFRYHRMVYCKHVIITWLPRMVYWYIIRKNKRLLSILSFRNIAGSHPREIFGACFGSPKLTSIRKESSFCILIFLCSYIKDTETESYILIYLNTGCSYNTKVFVVMGYLPINVSFHRSSQATVHCVHHSFSDFCSWNSWKDRCWPSSTQSI